MRQKGKCQIQVQPEKFSPYFLVMPHIIDNNGYLRKIFPGGRLQAGIWFRRWGKNGFSVPIDKRLFKHESGIVPLLSGYIGLARTVLLKGRRGGEAFGPHRQTDGNKNRHKQKYVEICR